MTAEPRKKAEFIKLDGSWFEKAEMTRPGQVAYKIRLDSDVLNWYRSSWEKYRNTISQVLREYKQKNIELTEKSDRIVESVELTWKFDPDVVQWLKQSKPNLANQILKDFMQSCKAKGEPRR